MYSEIKSAGRDLLKANGHKDLSAAYLKFQAYIRQAKTFYEAAETLHHRASALNYYYSFMNFAKALIFLKTPTFVDERLHHGIAQNPKHGSLRKQSVKIATDGVFPNFYRLVTKHTLDKSTTFKITNLLAYCNDVRFEYIKLKYGKGLSFPCRFILAFSANGKNIFPIIGVVGGKVLEFEPLRRPLEKHFEEVEIDGTTARNIFGMLAEQTAVTRFFQSKNEKVLPVNLPQLTDYLAAPLKGMISPVPFDDDVLFEINRPIRTPKLAPMNEMVAIYGCMFFLGSLVRYRPELLEAMLSTKDAWLIERFTKCAPLTFLRHIRNHFDEQYLVFVPR